MQQKEVDSTVGEAESERRAYPVSDSLENVDGAASGAPSEGEAVSDIFSTDEIFHRLMATAESEFRRTNRRLFLSGLAAGLSIGLTFLARATFAGTIGETDGFLVNVFYPIGFLFIVLGRYQLFTENTLTPVTLVLSRFSSIPRLLKLWGIVYAANLSGGIVTALLFAETSILSPEAAEAGAAFGREAMALPWTTLFVRGVVAGWMVAGMVWITHAVSESVTRFFIVYLVIFLIPSAGLFHCVIGACEISYLVFKGGASVLDALVLFELPVTLGNVIGGVLFVALPNYYQTRSERFEQWAKLSWSDWLRGERSDEAGSRLYRPA